MGLELFQVIHHSIFILHYLIIIIIKYVNSFIDFILLNNLNILLFSNLLYHLSITMFFNSLLLKLFTLSTACYLKIYCMKKLLLLLQILQFLHLWHFHLHLKIFSKISILHSMKAFFLQLHQLNQEVVLICTLF